MGKSFEDVVAALEAQQQARLAHVSPEDRVAATAAHELFLVLQSGGFTEDQALKIVAHRIAFADSEEQE